MTDTPTRPSFEDVLPDIIELPDRDGILLPADAAGHPSVVMDYFRRYCADVWGWADRVTNAGIDGPHLFVDWPAFTADPRDYVDIATQLLRDEELLPDQREQAIQTLSEQLAREASDAGGWRRSTVVPPGRASARYWKVRVGYVG